MAWNQGSQQPDRKSHLCKRSGTRFDRRVQRRRSRGHCWNAFSWRSLWKTGVRGRGNFLPARVQSYPTIRNRRVGAHGRAQDSWAQLDDVDLEVEFLRRVPMLKRCHTSCEGDSVTGSTSPFRNDAEQSWWGDTVGEERAWKAFGLVPAMMLHRPRGVGSIGRDELIERADKFSRGQWLELLGEYRSCTVLPWSRSDTG